MANASETAQAPGASARARLPGQVVLVLQGGGAIGAYQAGVYQALHEARVEPDWVIGTSIGAINGAIIAGNRPEDRYARLKSFWETARSDPPAPTPWPAANNAIANLETFAHGVPGMCEPNPQALWGLQARLGVEHAAFYTSAPLRQTLLNLVDFDILNSGKVRLSLGAVTVDTAQMRYFDSRDGKLGPEHVMASGALPPAFPAIRIGAEVFWDGAVYSNTPIEAVLDDHPRRNSVIFSVQLWNPAGPEPETILQVLGRQKEIQYASRAASNIRRQQQIHRLRHVIRELSGRLAKSQRDNPDMQKARLVRQLKELGYDVEISPAA